MIPWPGPAGRMASHNANYAYNAFGIQTTDEVRASAKLGLGLFGFVNLPVPESRVLVPSDMIAIGDCLNWFNDSISGFGFPGVQLVSLHKDGFSNAVFCDDHVESSDPDRISKQSYA